jgi:hypothetical protein
VPYPTLVCKMAAAVLADQRQTEAEGRAVAQLLSSSLLNCLGLVDAHVPAIVEVASARLLGSFPTPPALAAALAETVGAALYYNAAAALAAMEARGTTERVLGEVSSNTHRCRVALRSPQVCRRLLIRQQLYYNVKVSCGCVRWRLAAPQGAPGEVNMKVLTFLCTTCSSAAPACRPGLPERILKHSTYPFPRHKQHVA